MERRRMVVLALVALSALLVAVLALRNPQPSLQPRDADHRWSGPSDCLRCHGSTGSLPQSPGHPLGEDCLRCHGYRD